MSYDYNTRKSAKWQPKHPDTPACCITVREYHLLEEKAYTDVSDSLVHSAVVSGLLEMTINISQGHAINNGGNIRVS